MELQRDYPTPEEAADALVKNASGDGEGVLRDVLVEANGQATAYAHHMQQVNVLLDHVCDDTAGVVPFPLSDDLRDAQKHAQYAAEWFEEFAAKVKDAHDERFK